MDVTLAKNQSFFINPHLQGKSLSLNEDEAELNFTQFYNPYSKYCFLSSHQIYSYKSRFGDENERNDSIIVMALQVYSRRRQLNPIPVQTQEFELMTSTESNHSHFPLLPMFEDLNLLVALRKRVRKCTQYHMSNFFLLFFF